MAAKKKSKVKSKAVTAAKKKTVAKKPAPKAVIKAKSKLKAKPQAKAAPVATPKAKAKASPGVNWDNLITPLEDRLVVAAEGPVTVTSGGIIIPGTVNDRPFRGQVLAKGRGKRNKKGQIRPLDVSVGDQVMFAEWSGTKMDVGGREVLILREEDILGIVT